MGHGVPEELRDGPRCAMQNLKLLKDAANHEKVLGHHAHMTHNQSKETMAKPLGKDSQGFGSSQASAKLTVVIYTRLGRDIGK